MADQPMFVLVVHVDMGQKTSSHFSVRPSNVKMGRPRKMTPHQIEEALRRHDAGEPVRDIARTYDVSHSTISRLEA